MENILFFLDITGKKYAENFIDFLAKKLNE